VEYQVETRFDSFQKVHQTRRTIAERKESRG
jgi:hypothetical protein